MPRAPSRCGHCKEVGHTRPRCREFEVDIILQMSGGEIPNYPEQVNSYNIPKRLLAEIQLLKEGIIPEVVYKSHKQVNEVRKYEIVVITYETPIFNKETILYSEENWSTIHSRLKSYTEYMNEHEELLTEKCDKYLQRLIWLQRDLPGLINRWNGDVIPQVRFSTNTINELFHVDYIAVKERLFEAQTRQNNDMRIRMEERIQMQNVVDRVIREQDRWTNREPLPIIRETAIETDDCPICLETLGETAKVILRCGHQMCTTCMLTQTLRAATEKNAQTCHCPVCRTGYL